MAGRLLVLLVPGCRKVLVKPAAHLESGAMQVKDALRRTFARSALKRALWVAVVVGTILNAINQGPEILSGHEPVWWKLLLTYFVPFAVASYGCYSAFRHSD